MQRPQAGSQISAFILLQEEGQLSPTLFKTLSMHGSGHTALGPKTSESYEVVKLLQMLSKRVTRTLCTYVT